MSGKQSRARRVDAVNAARDGVYLLRGELPRSQFTCPRQTRIFDKYAAHFRQRYLMHEDTIREMQMVYGVTK